jgi:hypothetical protein
LVSFSQAGFSLELPPAQASLTRLIRLGKSWNYFAAHAILPVSQTVRQRIGLAVTANSAERHYHHQRLDSPSNLLYNKTGALL